MVSHFSQRLNFVVRSQKEVYRGKKEKTQTVFLGQITSQHRKPTNHSVYADFKLTTCITVPSKNTCESAQTCCIFKTVS